MQTSPDKNVEAIRAMLLQRSEIGLAKYGTTTADDTTTTLEQWLQHLLEETLDSAVYIVTAINKLNAVKGIKTTTKELAAHEFDYSTLSEADSPQIYAALLQSSSEEINSSTNPWYSRQPVTWVTNNNKSFNIKPITFLPVTNAITITHCALFNSATGGEIIESTELVVPKTCKIKDIPSFPTGSIVIYHD